jgi:2-methylcitrate dehydratase PrpD
MIGAQFSMPHCLAMTALGVPTGMAWFRDEALRDPKVDALRRRVQLVHDERAQKIYDQEKRYAGEVAVATKNGQVLTYFCPAPRGAPGNPFSEEDHRAKLFQMAARADLSAEKAEAIWTMLRKLEAVEDINALTRLLVPSP